MRLLGVKKLKLIFNIFIPERYNGAYGGNSTILYTVITLAVYKIESEFLVYGMVFRDGQSNSVIQIYPGLSLVARATKFGTKWAITRLMLEISARSLRL